MKQVLKKATILTLAVLLSYNVFASVSSCKLFGEELQDDSTHLVLKFYNIPENKYELEFLSIILNNCNFANDADLDKAIVEGHKYFVEHQDEILTEIKSQELLIFRDNIQNFHKRLRAERWSAFISVLPGILSNATVAAVQAGQQQQIEYQEKLNRDKKIQTYIAQHSSKQTKQYQQDFGRYSNVASINSPRVTTSNGFDEPLSSPNSYSTGQGTETVGIMVSNGSQQNVRIKVNGNTIVGIYVGGNVRSPLGDGWSQTNIQGIPTNIQLDGEWSKMYKNRATSRDIDNAIIYF